MSNIEDMMQHLDAANDESTDTNSESKCTNCEKHESRRREKVTIVEGGGPNRKGNKTEQRLTKRICPECGRDYTGASY